MPRQTEDSAARRARGADGERQARAWLEQQGLRCLAAGWRCRLGELDLVMQDGDVLAFIEVRRRQRDSLVGALESVDLHKRRRVIQAARAWLTRHPSQAALPARFDVVAIDDGTPAPTWIRNAFDATGH